MINWREKILTLFNKEHSTLVNISGNKNVVIKNNSFILQFFNDNSHLMQKSNGYDYLNDANVLFRNMAVKKLLLKSPLQKQIFYIDKLNEFKSIIERYSLQPIIRIKCLASGFCTLREASETSDLAQLELLEKIKLIELVKLNCEIRLTQLSHLIVSKDKRIYEGNEDKNKVNNSFSLFSAMWRCSTRKEINNLMILSNDSLN